MRSQKMPGATSMAEPTAGSCSSSGYFRGKGVARASGIGITGAVGNVDMRQVVWVSIRIIDVNVNVKHEITF